MVGNAQMEVVQARGAYRRFQGQMSNLLHITADGLVVVISTGVSSAGKLISLFLSP